MRPDRGIIYDRNGEKLAISVMADSVCADPSKIINMKPSAQIAKILNLDRKTILQRISVPKNFCWLARKNFPEQKREREREKKKKKKKYNLQILKEFFD